MKGDKMTKTCKYPDKDCENRYLKRSKSVLICRLDEWKTKVGTCPYNKSIHSKTVANKAKGQMTLDAVVRKEK